MRVRSLPVTDALAVPGEPDLLVMKGEGLIRLGPLGRRIFEAAEEPRTVDQLVDDAITAFGAIPRADAEKAVTAAVATMVDAGLAEVLDA